MIDTLTIEGYRAIKTLTLHPKRINLLVGANNSGKSSILEILSLCLLAQNEMKDMVGTNVWQYLTKTKQYSPHTIVHTGCNESLITIKNKKFEITTSLTFQETGYCDTTVGGIISNKIYTDAENYLYTTDFLKTLRSNIDSFGSLVSFDSGENTFPSYPPKSDRDPTQEISLVEQELLSHIKQKIVQEAFEAPKIIISVTDNAQITHVYGEILLRHLKRQTGNITGIAGLSNIITGLKPYKKPLEASTQFPTIVRMKSQTDFAYINLLFEKMMEGWEIQTFEKIISEKIPYVVDIKKSSEKGILVYLKGESTPRSLTSMGDGFIALVEILALHTLVKNGVIIMEEPENNLHPGFIDVFSEQVIRDINDNQYFISTHSADVIETILERAKHSEKLKDISLIILYKHMHLTYSVAEEMNGVQALDEIESIHSDLRGI